MHENTPDLIYDRRLVDIVWNDSPVVIMVTDDSGRYLYINSMVQKFMEYTVDELINTRMNPTHPIDSMTDSAIRAQLRDGDFDGDEYTNCKRYITKTGRTVWGATTIHYVRSRNGGVSYFLLQIVPLDAMNHINNRTFDALDEQNRGLNIGDGGSSKKEQGGTRSVATEPTSLLQLIDKYKWVLGGGITVISALIIFLSDFKYNQKRISDLDSKIEAIDANVKTQFDEMKKLIERSLNNRK